MPAPRDPQHRGGSGTPLVLLHGFMDTWHTWELVLPALEARHDVLAPTLAGHAGAAPLPDGPPADAIVDAVEAAMDAAGIGLAHVAGNSLGGFVALQLAARGRARTVTALAPAGGWAPDDVAYRALLGEERALYDEVRLAAPLAGALAATAWGRRRATRSLTVRSEHIPADLVARLIAGVAGCTAAPALLDAALEDGWPPLDVARVTCPVRIVWGTADALLPWPAAAAGYRARLPQADWVVLDDVGHAPQLDVPLETAALILGQTGG